MKKLYLVLTILSISTFAQKNLNKEADKIVAEGKILYKSEMASWYGTDIFIANYPQRENISGYFSYIDEGVPKCIFFSGENKVIGTVAFPTNYEPKDAKLDLKERVFSTFYFYCFPWKRGFPKFNILKKNCGFFL